MYDIIELISKEKIQNRIKELSNQINNFYSGEELYVICILKGAVMFTCDLVRNLNMPVTLDFMIASSYRDKTFSITDVDIIKDIDVNIQGKNVIIIDDIIDTGKTLKKIRNILNKRNPKSIELCTLFDKPSRREVNIDVKFIGFTIPNEFIVGYGLDYDQKYRNLNYIGKVKTLKK